MYEVHCIQLAAERILQDGEERTVRTFTFNWFCLQLNSIQFEKCEHWKCHSISVYANVLDAKIFIHDVVKFAFIQNKMLLMLIVFNHVALR